MMELLKDKRVMIGVLVALLALLAIGIFFVVRRAKAHAAAKNNLTYAKDASTPEGGDEDLRPAGEGTPETF